MPDGEWGPLFAELAMNVDTAQPLRPTPLSPDGLLDLFDAHTTGRDYVLQPATMEEMCGVAHIVKPSLEVVYEAV